MRYEDGFPEPIGVFRCVDAPRYDVLINGQIDEAIQKRGKGDIEALFNSGDTWTVE
jgi:2-oxoglutarate ferredoxin oxidoreductase subunit beta